MASAHDLGGQHLGAAAFTLKTGNARFRIRASVPTEIPQIRHPGDAPQNSHGRNGIPRHTAARLLKWSTLALTSHYAGRQGRRH
jgi:hypothetical protein